jgi:hypothetical protein
MNSTGTEQQQPLPDAPIAPETPRRGFSPVILGVLAVLLFGAGILAVQLFGVIYGLVFPPDPPLPSGAAELRHDNLSYGVDDWLYGTTQDGCAVMDYYVAQGGACSITPGMCSTGAFVNPNVGTQNVGSCVADVSFSIFQMRWEVDVASGYSGEHPTQFRLKREVYWIGSPPIR